MKVVTTDGVPAWAPENPTPKALQAHAKTMLDLVARGEIDLTRDG